MPRLLYRIFITLLALVTAITGTTAPRSAGQGDRLPEGVPPFGAGICSTALYNSGTGLDRETPTEDFPDPSPTDSYVRLVKNASLTDFLRYCARLENAGWRQTFFNQLEQNVYAAYEKDGRQIYLWRSGTKKEVRVADDCCNTVTPDAFGYETDAEPVAQPAVWQFSVPYKDPDRADPERYASNGMLYAVLLSDGKLMIIDGGAKLQASNGNVEELWRFLHSIAGKKPNAKLRIALWVGTHAHGDHSSLFLKFLRRYREKVTVERALFNFPSKKVFPASAAADRVRAYLRKFCPGIKYVKARPGFAFRLQDAECQVLYTHEDHASAEDASVRFDNLNDASLVFRLTLGGRTFLFLGDANLLAEEALLTNFSPDFLRSDVLQAAHHLYNNLGRLYAAVRPEWVFCPQSKLRAQTQPLEAYHTLLSLVPEERLLFAGDGDAYGLAPSPDGGGLTKRTFALHCGPYDFTGFDGAPVDDLS